MATTSNIPVTLEGSLGGSIPALHVGGNKGIGPPGVKLRDANRFWYLVLDLSNPTGAPVLNEVSKDNVNPPSGVLPFLGKPDYLLCFSFINVFTSHVPQGGLYQFLRQVGSGPELQRAEQLVEQLGSNAFDVISYGLAATTIDTDSPGFEALDFYHEALLTFELMPVDVGGKTVYAPVQLGG